MKTSLTVLTGLLMLALSVKGEAFDALSHGPENPPDNSQLPVSNQTTSLPDIDCLPYFSVCSYSEPLNLDLSCLCTLNGLCQGGGYFSGPGVEYHSGYHFFNPAVGLGEHQLWYIYFDQDLQAEFWMEFTMEVLPPPEVQCPENIDVSLTTPTFELDLGQPTGGEYLVNGQLLESPALFDPMAAGPGVHQASYHYPSYYIFTLPVIPPLPEVCKNSCDFTITVQAEGLILDLSLALEGPYSPGENTLMHTALRDNGFIPVTQPFNPNLPFHGNPIPQWYYNGTESVESMPADVVDWVLLEIRDASAGALAYSNTRVARQAALLLNTGQVVGTNGLPPVFDVEIEFGLFVVVYHRNHLAVMSSQPLQAGNGVYSWDFTQDAAMAFGNGQKHLGNGLYGLMGGDGDGNGQIQNQDKNNVWNPQAGQSGYLAGDFDLNGQVQNQDKNNQWNTNSGNASQMPGLSQGVSCPGMPSFTDPRDGTTYNTVYINEQCWLKEDLRYLLQVSSPDAGSRQLPHFYVYNYSGDAVEEAMATPNYHNYGVLYNWPAAFNACPNGWHLPTDESWSQLTTYLINNYDDITSHNVGNKLKSCRQLGSPLGDDCDTGEHPRWNYHQSVFGTNEFGFSALPGGARVGSGNFMYLGSNVYFWNATPTGEADAYRRHITVGAGGVGRGSSSKEAGFSVRCLRDAQFGLPEHNLNIQVVPDGAGNVYGAGTYPQGRDILLTAQILQGSFFLNWTMDGEIISSEPAFIFTMPGQEVTITANFAVGGGQPCPGMETITDPRDGKVYNTVLIGDQCWLRENLDHETATSWCYSNNTENCEAYGRLYTWEEAMVVCPAGWRLPTHDEWTTMEREICSLLGHANCETAFPYNTATTGWRGTNEGNALKSCRQVNSPLGDDCLTSDHPRWNSHTIHYGFDAAGFAALPAGHRSSSGFWLDMGTWLKAWTATPQSETNAWVRYIPHQRSDMGREHTNKAHALSVRCIKD
jgi:uncharacterized protein (TIGR02145 family)